MASKIKGGLTISNMPAKLVKMERRIDFYSVSRKKRVARIVVTIGVVKKIAIASLRFIILIAR